MSVRFVHRFPQMDILCGHRNRCTADTNVQCVMDENITIDAKHLRAQIALVHILVQIGERFLACVAQFTLFCIRNLTEMVHREQMMIGPSQVRR